MDSFHHISASDAASDEQGNSSMCSYEGHFINITEDQLNKGNSPTFSKKNEHSGDSGHASPKSHGKKKSGKSKKASAAMLFSVGNRIPKSF